MFDAPSQNTHLGLPVFSFLYSDAAVLRGLIIFNLFIIAGVLAYAIAVNTQTPTLKIAGTHGALAGSDVTNTGVTTVYGSFGIRPGTSITSFAPGVATGVYSCGDPTAGTAQAAATAYGQATSLLCGTGLTGSDLGDWS